MDIRPATAEDLEAVTAIYNAGIAEREATFETRERDAGELREWLTLGPFLVATDEHGDVVGFARVGPYSTREVYRGVGEHGVYVAPAARGGGLGRALLEAIAQAADAAGLHKLTARIFSTNAASLAAHRAAGFTEVGVQRSHARLDGVWRDVVLVERLLGEAAGSPQF